jgi:hypothetical protein
VRVSQNRTAARNANVQARQRQRQRHAPAAPAVGGCLSEGLVQARSQQPRDHKRNEHACMGKTPQQECVSEVPPEPLA